LVFFLRPTIIPLDEPKNAAAMRQIGQFSKKDRPDIIQAMQAPDSVHKD
jgi:hypothetical protein